MEPHMISSVSGSTPSKATARHLSRAALLYVRQSTARQVLENQESTRRQYGLRERAIALGWAASQVETIDTDLGQSGASAADRAGFQRLVAEVSMGRVGIVLGLEVSRLARNNSDWHRLLELCALGDTLFDLFHGAGRSLVRLYVQHVVQIDVATSSIVITGRSLTFALASFGTAH